MASQIYVNLPVQDLARSVAFFTALGFAFDPQFSDDKAACLVLGPNIYAMLLQAEFFRTFTRKPVSDAHAATEVLVAIDAESREAVDAMVRAAVAAGGSVSMEPQDHGWMYGHGFADPDGHQWEVLYMDLHGMPQY